MHSEKLFLEKMEEIVGALREAGFDPYAQLSGYLRTGNDAYITCRNNARMKIRGLDTGKIRKYLEEDGGSGL